MRASAACRRALLDCLVRGGAWIRPRSVATGSAGRRPVGHGRGRPLVVKLCEVTGAVDDLAAEMVRSEVVSAIPDSAQAKGLALLLTVVTWLILYRS